MSDLVFVPPFAEELNKSRHTVGRMARALAQRGYGVLVVDLYGTGDSEGSFEECRWETWRTDVMAAQAWLRERGRDTIGLWGLRLGALLAADVAADHPNLFSRLLLWQPVLSGKQFLQQLLRLRVAGSMADGTGSPLSVSGLRQRLAAGEPLHISGYPVAPALAHAFESLDLTKFDPSPETRVLWMEVVQEETAKLSRSSLDVIDAWKARGVNTKHVTVIDRQFWSFQSLEPIWADALIATTLELL